MKKICKEKAIFFESFSGNSFQGNPYYIFKTAFMSLKQSGYSFYISVKDVAACEVELSTRHLLDERIHLVKTDSEERNKLLSESKYIVTNVSLDMFFVKQKGQIILNTWHGTPLKTLGRCVAGDPYALANAQRNFLLADYLIAPNSLLKDIYNNDHMIHDIMPGSIIGMGYPRNSIFFDEESRCEVRKKLSIENKKTVFYMPTWREGDQSVHIQEIEKIDKLAGELADQCVFFYKLHPAVSSASGKFHFMRSMPNQFEVYEFLNAMDILITDYSSVYFDYANTKRQIILYQYDDSEYYKNRGVYSEVRENTPYVVVKTIKDLKETIINPKLIDDQKFRDRFCKNDNIHACVDCLNLLLGDREIRDKPKIDLYVLNFPVSDKKLRRWKSIINNPKARFVFLPGSKFQNLRYRKVSCFDKIDYFVYFKNEQLTHEQEKHPNEQLMLLEQRRLWGDVVIANVYAKKGHLPPALSMNRKKWPKELK